MSHELISIIIAILGLISAIGIAYFIKKKKVTEEKAAEIASHIREGAMAFLHKEYKILIIFIIVVFAILFLVPQLGWRVAVSFLSGAIFSAVSGNIGMRIATLANARTASAAALSQ